MTFTLTRRALAGLALAAALTGPALAQDSFTVGSTPTGVPFTFLDVATDRITGVMVDIIEAIGAEEGFTPTVEATQWSALIPSLTANKIDIIAAAMYATEERAKVVDFTDTVYSYGEGLIVPTSDQTDYTSPQDLAGKTVGVQVGTAYVAPMEALGVFREVKIYDNLADIMRDVQLGRLDGGFGDYPILAYQIGNGAADVRLVETYQTTVPGNVAIAVRKDDAALLGRLNDGLAKIKANGQLDEILAKWGLN